MKKQVLLFHILLIIGQGLFASSQISPHTFLFCIKPELQPFRITLNRGKTSVGIAELDDYFQSHKVQRIEPWIKNATERDRDGDIYLNRIYRAYLGDNRENFIRLDKNERTVPFTESDIENMFSDLKSKDLTMYPDQTPIYKAVSKFLNISSIDLVKINFEYSRFSIEIFANFKNWLNEISRPFFLNNLSIFLILDFSNLNLI